MKELKGYQLLATDGKIGKTKDFLFDDLFWTIRYMVADTAKWFIGRKVLISPKSLDTPDWASQTFPVSLSKQQIKDAPDLSENEPVSRQYEQKFYEYFGWPFYWSGAYAASAVATPVQYSDSYSRDVDESDLENPHLRSFNEVRGYQIYTTDSKEGYVKDFIVDDQLWIVRYMVMDTGNWLPGRKILVSPQWISDIDWDKQRINVDLSSESIEASPEYDPSQPINRKYEVELYDFYGRPSWWSQS